MTFKKLNARGFSHDIVMVLFVMIFAIVGVGYLVASHAATSTTPYTSTNQFSSFVYVPPAKITCRRVSTVPNLTHSNTQNLTLQFNTNNSCYQSSTTAMYELTLPANTVANSLTMNVSYINNGYNTDFVAAGTPSNMVWKVNTHSTQTNQSVTITLSNSPTVIYFGLSGSGASGGFKGSYPAIRNFIVNSYTLNGTTTVTTANPTPPPSSPPVSTGGSCSTTTPATPSTDSGLLFNGTQISEYNLDQSVHLVLAPDPVSGTCDSVFEMAVNNGDTNANYGSVEPTDNPRSQLLGPATLTAGENYWWSTKFLLPSSAILPSDPFPTSFPASGWMSLMEGAYGPPFNGSPPVSFGVGEVNGVEQIGWQRNGNVSANGANNKYDEPYTTPAAPYIGQWTYVLFNEQLGTCPQTQAELSANTCPSDPGYIKMWLSTDPTTLGTSATQLTFFNSGIYNFNSIAPTQQVNMSTLDNSNDCALSYNATFCTTGTGYNNNFDVIQQYRESNMGGEFNDTVTTYEGPLIMGQTEASVLNAITSDAGD